jgi:hypothetical protein
MTMEASKPDEDSVDTASSKNQSIRLFDIPLSLSLLLSCACLCESERELLYYDRYSRW